MSQQLEGEIVKLSKKYIITGVIICIANCAVFWFNLLLIRYARTQEIQDGFETKLPDGFIILSTGIVISLFTLSMIILIVKSQYSKNIFKVIMLSCSLVFLLIYSVFFYLLRDLLVLNFQ